MFTVIESPLFSKIWPNYWHEEERAAFAAFLSSHPEAGAVVPGAEGLRKVRWGRDASGKSSGVRVIYFARQDAGQLILLTMYAKSKLGNLPAHTLLEIKHALDDAAPH